MRKCKIINKWFSDTLKKALLLIRVSVFLLMLTFVQAGATESYPRSTKLAGLSENTALDDISVALQEMSVSGRVVDKGGMPMPGVNIVVLGTTQGAVTDLDGYYTIDVPSSDAVLSFSFLGYLTEEIKVSGRTVIDVTLIEDILILDEVVVTALGIKREQKALGYSVQELNGEELQTVKGIDISTSLTGKIAGLQIRNTTEFAEEDSINLRGAAPLIVIDGVPYGNMTLRDIPPDDIEDISVLKGATASALYGYRGGSGAIMITTKKGSKDKGVTVSVNTSTMFNAGFLAIPEQQSKYGRVLHEITEQESIDKFGGQFVGKLTYDTRGEPQGTWGTPMDGRMVVQWDPISKSWEEMPYLPKGKDNFKNFLEQGFILNNNISLTQQGENGSIRSSANWVKNKGVYPNSIFDKITYSIGGDIKINKFLLSTSMAYNKQISPNTGTNGYTGYDPMFALLIWSTPDYDVRDYKDYWIIPDEKQNTSYTTKVNNPYYDRCERTHSLNRDVFNGSLSVNYDFTSWLTATVRSGFDIYSEQQELKVPKNSLVNAGSSKVLKYGKEIWGEKEEGSYNMGLGRGYSLSNDMLLLANQTFGNITIDGLLGGSIFYKQDDGMEGLTRGGLSIPGFYSLLASINEIYLNTRVRKEQVNSIYGRLALSWKSLFFLEGTARNDWHSALYAINSSQEKDYYFYPSVASSFVISELLPELDWLSLWKIRGSWTTSKIPASPYQVNSVYEINKDDWSLDFMELPRLIRGDVSAEGARTYEIGTAINIFKNRASFDVAYFNKRKYNRIDDAEGSHASGFDRTYINTDEERTTKGIEITTNVTPIKSREWKWNVSINWSRYLEYYTQLDELYSDDKPWVAVGKRTDHFILKHFDRDPDGNIVHNNGLPRKSDYYLFYDYRDPDWIWGLSTSVNYKNFTFSISADGRVGGLVPSFTESYMWLSGNHPDSDAPERYLDETIGGANYLSKGVTVVSGSVTYDRYGYVDEDNRVFALNTDSVRYEDYVKAIHSNFAWGGTVSPYDAFSGTFFKIREVSLSYALPKDFCAKFAAKSASISTVAQNVFLWAKDFKYSDPDRGRENFADPSMRYVGVNIKVTF